MYGNTAIGFTCQSTLNGYLFFSGNMNSAFCYKTGYGVCPIFKHGLKTDMNNYRPISILPYLSKLFEKVMYTRLYNYINKLEILHPDQHGFQPNHSTAMSVLNTYGKLNFISLR